MWERGVLQGPRRAALGPWQVRRAQTPPGRREENRGGDSAGQSTQRLSCEVHTSPLPGPQRQPLRPLSLPLACQPLPLTHRRSPPTAQPPPRPRELPLPPIGSRISGESCTPSRMSPRSTSWIPCTRSPAGRRSGGSTWRI